jgi:two-component system chemotaxis response regulator CheB
VNKNLQQLIEHCRKQKIRYVGIGTSAGGVDALKILLPSFKKPSTLSVVVVLHLPPEGPNLIPSLFQDLCEFRLKEAEPGEPLESETIYIATPNYHLSVESDGSCSLSNESPVNFSRPSIDVLFESLGYAQKEKVLGILMTGANGDGAKGLHLISRFGGRTLVQNPMTAEYPMMPESALDIMKPDAIFDLRDAPEFIKSIGKDDAQ